jgi:hypothetical protein
LPPGNHLLFFFFDVSTASTALSIPIKASSPIALNAGTGAGAGDHWPPNGAPSKSLRFGVVVLSIVGDFYF